MQFIKILSFLFIVSGCSSYQEIPIKIISGGEESSYGDPDHELEPFEDPNNKLMGYKNKEGKIAIKAQFQKALSFSKDGVADVYKTSEGWLKIRKSGEILHKSFLFDTGPDYYLLDRARFVENGKIGFADKTGKIIIPASFDFAAPFHYTAPVALVCNGCKTVKDAYGMEDIIGGKWGAIDHQGNIVVPVEFDRSDAPPDNHKKDLSTLTFYKGEQSYNLYLTDKGEYKLVPSLAVENAKQFVGRKPAKVKEVLNLGRE